MLQLLREASWCGILCHHTVLYTSCRFFLHCILQDFHWKTVVEEAQISSGLGSKLVCICALPSCWRDLVGRNSQHYIENVFRQHGGNCVVILQVVGYKNGQMQALKSSRNFQIREIRVVEEEVCR